MPSRIRIIEVSPRDGLQNEKIPVPTDVKLNLIAGLARAGLTEIEVSSFVSPKWVPQLGDVADLWPQLPAGPAYSALVPNAKGLERAFELGVDRIALFTAASSAFTEKNINCTREESLAHFSAVADTFRSAVPNGFIRGYVSTIFECPHAGQMSPADVAPVVEALFAIGVDEVSLGDTTGVGTPREVRELAGELSNFEPHRMVWHFHDTRGTAIANVAAALELGYTAFDSSAGGLGGCPYAPGAGGNLATEDLVYFAGREGLTSGVDPIALAQASLPVLAQLGRSPLAKAQLATLASCSPEPRQIPAGRA